MRLNLEENIDRDEWMNRIGVYARKRASKHKLCVCKLKRISLK